MLTNTLIAEDRRAVSVSVDIVAKVTAADLGRPTPCSEWTVADLLAHMTVQHHGFAAAAEGRGADLDVWQVQPLGADPVVDYITAADRVNAAFTAAGVLEREFALGEFGPKAKFPAAMAIGFHFIDYVVHGWDIAKSLGLPFELDAELVEPALRNAEAVPDGPSRLKPGAAFRPRLPWHEDAAHALDRILRLLGRSPNWTP